MGEGCAQRWGLHGDGGDANTVHAPPLCTHPSHASLCAGRGGRELRVRKRGAGGRRERGGALAADDGIPGDADPFPRCRY